MTSVPHIEITGVLVHRIMMSVRLNKILKQLKEMENELQELIDELDYESDYDSCLRASRFLR